MQRQIAAPFNDAAKMLAGALHDAGQTDREIADACSTSVNNIIWWRRDAGLGENLSAEAKARAAEEAYTPPVRRPTTSLRTAPRVPRAQPVQIPDALTPAQAQAAYVAPVQPAGDAAIEIGAAMGRTVHLDLEELLTTRLLVQGNSGSGKSHLLRKLLEESAGIVQQIVVDPEGDFVTMGDMFGHTVIDAAALKGRVQTIAGKVRSMRGSAVLNLEGLDTEEQMRVVAAFLNGLFDAPREHWHPALVVVDEAHLFASSQDNGEDKLVRKECLAAMQNLMCRGRKRGLAGVIATQRLAKLHKNVAAEASNFLMGRTFLDIDLGRVADLLGLPPRATDDIRNLNRGEFLGLGPAIARRPLKVTIGNVLTEGKASAPQGLTALPSIAAEAMSAALLADDEDQITDAVVVPFQRAAK